MPQNVLIADDSMSMHELVRVHLQRDGLALHCVNDGESALSAAASLRPELILLDVDMPRLDGFEVCKRLKANSMTAGVPIIFLTADAVAMDKVKGLDLGAADYICKPFKPDELRARVRSVLRAKHQLDKTALVDALSGCWNRAYFDVHLPVQLSAAKRSGLPLACIVADVDRLRAINARHGQSAGDDVLKSIGRILLGGCRAADIVCRLQEGTFAILMPGTASKSAAQIAERLRSEIERQLKFSGSTELHATCSFGVADTLSTPQTLVDRADAAACWAKREGRNCVSVSRCTDRQAA